MRAVQEVQVTVDQIVDMVAMRNRFVAAARPVLVAGLMTSAGMRGRASSGVLTSDRQDMLIYMILMQMVEVTVVQVVRMVVVTDDNVAAAGLMSMRMGIMSSVLGHGNLLVGKRNAKGVERKNDTRGHGLSSDGARGTGCIDNPEGIMLHPASAMKRVTQHAKPRGVGRRLAALTVVLVVLALAPFAAALEVHHALAGADQDGHQHSEFDLCQWVQLHSASSVDLGVADTSLLAPPQRHVPLYLRPARSGIVAAATLSRGPPLS
jgi:hypothetical protein